MLFENKNCEKCGSSYDIVESTCPTCGAHNNEVEKRKINQNITWLPVWKQLVFFAVGFVLLNVLSIFVQLILANFYSEEDITFAMLNNVICYSVVFVAMFLLVIGHYRKFWKPFANWVPYFTGFAFGILLIICSMTYNAVTNIIFSSGTNSNQNTANEMIATYPFISILLIGLVGPIVEEFTYRLGLFSFLRRINVWVAYLVTIAFFAFIHFTFSADNLVQEFISLPNYIMAGFTFCILYDKCGFAASVTAHITNNLTSALLIAIATLLTR